jgi:hypothetical protein
MASFRDVVKNWFFSLGVTYVQIVYGQDLKKVEEAPLSGSEQSPRALSCVREQDPEDRGSAIEEKKKTPENTCVHLHSVKSTNHVPKSLCKQKATTHQTYVYQAGRLAGVKSLFIVKLCQGLSPLSFHSPKPRALVGYPHFGGLFLFFFFFTLS